MNKVVKYVRFHSTLFMPNVGNIEQTLPPSNKTIPNLKMTACAGGIEVCFGGDIGLVPWSNVQFAVFEPEAKSASLVATAHGVKKAE